MLGYNTTTDPAVPDLSKTVSSSSSSSMATATPRVSANSAAAVALYNKQVRHGVFDSPSRPVVGVETNSSGTAAVRALSQQHDLSPEIWRREKTAAAAGTAALFAHDRDTSPQLWRPEPSQSAQAASAALYRPRAADSAPSLLEQQSLAAQQHLERSASRAALSAHGTDAREMAARALPDAYTWRDRIAQRQSELSRSSSGQTELDAQGNVVTVSGSRRGSTSDAVIGSVLESRARANAEQRLAKLYLSSNDGNVLRLANTGSGAAAHAASATDEERARRTLKDKDHFKKAVADHERLMAAARERAQSSLASIDRSLLERGLFSGDVKLNAAAYAVAESRSKQRMENLGKIQIANGVYMTQSEIDAIAERNVKPVLAEISLKADQQRAADEERRKAEEEDRAIRTERKRLERENRDEERRIAREEKAETKAVRTQQKAEQKAVRMQQKAENRERKAQLKQQARELKDQRQKLHLAHQSKLADLQHSEALAAAELANLEAKKAAIQAKLEAARLAEEEAVRMAEEARLEEERLEEARLEAARLEEARLEQERLAETAEIAAGDSAGEAAVVKDAVPTEALKSDAEDLKSGAEALKSDAAEALESAKADIEKNETALADLDSQIATAREAHQHAADATRQAELESIAEEDQAKAAEEEAERAEAEAEEDKDEEDKAEEDKAEEDKAEEEVGAETEGETKVEADLTPVTNLEVNPLEGSTEGAATLSNDVAKPANEPETKRNSIGGFLTRVRGLSVTKPKEIKEKEAKEKEVKEKEVKEKEAKEKEAKEKKLNDQRKEVKDKVNDKEARDKAKVLSLPFKIRRSPKKPLETPSDSSKGLAAKAAQAVSSSDVKQAKAEAAMAKLDSEEQKQFTGFSDTSDIDEEEKATVASAHDEDDKTTATHTRDSAEVPELSETPEDDDESKTPETQEQDDAGEETEREDVDPEVRKLAEQANAYTGRFKEADI